MTMLLKCRAQLGLLQVRGNTQLALPVGKFALLALRAGSSFHEVLAQLC
eukprot:CAMPEP_0204251674 /NCGR_PEP_ID=MMETSP0468-20130131/481_1 /ASSEMBLY_ACC=CAM_ASM_000383 /TAXON_ID=2969 /ORGANISM="Oxyrrhis marina" /LENGTH=48 /DNA_ID= /DNA_START= /DNA_END= /DNA_ORIENTATION=